MPVRGVTSPTAWFATAAEVDASRALYVRLLGSSWQTLAEPLRLVHATTATVRASGCLRISHGRSRLARLLVRLLRLPRAGDAVETRLLLAPCAGGVQWLRTFDDRRLDTWQYEAGERELAERIGVLEFRFRLEAADGSLRFQQVGAAVRLGFVRLQVPGAWAPRIDAREDPAGARQLFVQVRVTLPALGPVLTYDGTIEIQDART